MKMPAILLAGVCGIAPAVCVQQVGAQAVGLSAITVNVAKPPFDGHYSLQGKPACDGAGNVYTRAYDAATTRDGKRFNQLPIHEVSPNGAPVRDFRVADDFPDGTAMGMSVGLDGGIYQAVMTNHYADISVEKFAQDGSAKAKTRLEAGSRLHTADFTGSIFHVAVFKSGEYLLNGETGKGAQSPYLAVFGADGHLVKEIYEPEDEEARQKAALGDADYAPDRVGNFFSSLGDVAAGSDGNAYLLRRTPRGSLTLVYVISPAGEVVSKLRIDAGDSDLVARSIRSYAGRIAVGFGSRTHMGPYRVKIVDLQGNSVAEYSLGSNAVFVGDEGLDLACYGAEGLTLVPDRIESKAYMLRAKLP
jgi:hypothetical protein